MQNELFEYNGVHVLVDGQFGSTGKGALAAWLAEKANEQGLAFEFVVSNAGPNSGHTFYDCYDTKHVLKQLPTFAVAAYENGYVNVPVVYLSAGAVIDPEILAAEAHRYPGLVIYVDPMAAIISHADKEAEMTGSIAAVAGTRSGNGQAIANKVLRKVDAVYGSFAELNPQYMPSNVHCKRIILNSPDTLVFVEVSQGFSLGINSEFYPKVTSRECTVAQACADARINPRLVEKVYVCARTFPIRVGNVDGFSSGGHYPDQVETTWEDVGQPPELTTVTQRVRRVFTFSEQQLQEAVDCNGANFVFINFMNYLDEAGQVAMLETLDGIRDNSQQWFDIIQGYGARSKNIRF